MSRNACTSESKYARRRRAARERKICENGSTAQARFQEGKVGVPWLASEIPSSAFSRGMRSYGKTRSVLVESFLPRGAHPSFLSSRRGRRKRMIGRSLESCPLGAGKCRSIYTAPWPVDRRGNAWQTAPSFY